MTAMLRLLLALAIEVRAGDLKKPDLTDRAQTFFRAVLNRTGTAEKSPFLEARQRYPGADLDSRALSDETIIALLIDGVVDPETIRRDLDGSTYFVVVDEEPEWRTLWYGLERTDDEVAAALERVEAKFAGRAYTAPGEILHVFGLRLNLSRHGVLSATLAKIVAECQSYIDDLYEARRLEPTPPHGGPSAMRESGYGGLQIAASDTPEYLGLFRDLENKRAQVAVDRYPAQAAELLDMLRATPDQFIDLIAPGRGQQSQYARIPVLAQMPSDEFVAALLSQRPNVQRQLLNALETRYEHRLLQGELAPELPWAQRVKDQLTAASATMLPFGRYRMAMFIAQSFDKIPELTLPPPQSRAATQP